MSFWNSASNLPMVCLIIPGLMTDINWPGLGSLGKTDKLSCYALLLSSMSVIIFVPGLVNLYSVIRHRMITQTLGGKVTCRVPKRHKMSGVLILVWKCPSSIFLWEWGGSWLEPTQTSSQPNKQQRLTEFQSNHTQPKVWLYFHLHPNQRIACTTNRPMAYATNQPTREWLIMIGKYSKPPKNHHL